MRNWYGIVGVVNGVERYFVEKLFWSRVLAEAISQGSKGLHETLNGYTSPDPKWPIATRQWPPETVLRILRDPRDTVVCSRRSMSASGVASFVVTSGK